MWARIKKVGRTHFIVLLTMDIRYTCHKFKDPKMGFPKYGTKHDWLWRRLNMSEEKYGGSYWPLPEVEEGFTKKRARNESEDSENKRPKIGAKEALRQDCVTMMRALRTNPLFLVQYDRLAYQSENYPCPKKWKTLVDLTAHLNWLEMLTEFYSDYESNKNTQFSKRWQLLKHVSRFKI